MTPEIKSAVKGALQFVCAGSVALITSLAASGAQAQSAYGCRALETHPALAAVEGKSGTFFAIRPELQSHHGLGDATIDHLSKLTEMLRSRGTTLVLMPVPTRAQVLSHLLPPMATHLGFDADAATAVHLGMIARLQAAGVNVADARADLRRASLNGTPAYFGTDTRPTNTGVRLLAQSVGAVLEDHPDLSDITRATFVSAPGKVIALTSDMRAQLQSGCQSELPAVRVQTQTITRAGDVATEPLVVIGTDITATDALNMAGSLSQATGLDAVGYGVPGGGAFAAMSSYLTSTAFQDTPPRVLVWEWPVSAPFADRGHQPMRELIAAASTACSTVLPMVDARADLTGLTINADTALAFDADGAALPFVRFHFTNAAGLVRTRSIYRHADQTLTGRFYLSLSGLDTQSLASVQIETPTALGAQPRLNACF
ncbi:alginate O-acetyltransferase AlgX-related protein [Tateyamaria sp.]|uniref:alginate O-acetyltransferase AlgX-related protein n=1 Tax=Tateyamaria sp. TaxID=1929288 RepID=UPI00329E79BF